MDDQPGIRDISKCLWLAVDLDGTLATGVFDPENPRNDIGLPMWDNIKKTQRARDAGYKIVIHTSRPWWDYEAIEWWCQKYGVPVSRIVCGKLQAVAYIDDKNIPIDAENWIPGRWGKVASSEQADYRTTFPPNYRSNQD